MPARYTLRRANSYLWRIEIKRTFQPKKLHRVKVHGFRERMSTPGGRNVIRARRLKGRRRLAPSATR